MVDPGSLGTVQQTLLIPLWARAEWSRRFAAFQDPHSERLVESLQYDFEEVRKRIGTFGMLNLGYRSVRMDRIARDFLKRHPGATIVNLGCGLDTLYERIDDGQAHVVNVDMPDTVALRNRLLPPSDRSVAIGASILEDDWKAALPPGPVLVLLAGVSMYLTRAQIHKLLRGLVGLRSTVEVAVDVMAPRTIRASNFLMGFSRLPQAPLSFGAAGAQDLMEAIPGGRLIQSDYLLSGLGKGLGLPWQTRSLAQWGCRLFPERLYQIALPQEKRL
ncbi:class I SAM-dependent methyltransferase [bacterium]|nr:class I SAM-dependent methyltransferase [bacterium]